MSKLPLFARLAVILFVCLVLTGCKSKVTKDNFDKVKDGMTMEEVVKLLGKGVKDEGDGSNVAGQFGVAVQSAPTVGANGAETYVWETNKATVRISFRGGKVILKSANGF